MLNVSPDLLAQLSAQASEGNIVAQVLENLLEATGFGVNGVLAFSGPGALPPLARTVNITANNAGDVDTLANGVTTGQRKTLRLAARTHAGVDTAVVTPASGGPWTLTNVGEDIDIEWSGTAWVLIRDNRASFGLDANAADIQPVGTAAAAGAVGQPADAGHVHTLGEAALRQAGAALTAALAVNSQKITGLGTPAAGTDAATKAYVDTGDTAPANLQTAAAALTSALAVNSQKVTNLANGTASSDAAAFGQIPVADATATDIQPLAAAPLAGATGKWADAGHKHQSDKAAFHVVYFTGVNGAGPATATGVKVGDQVLLVLDLTAAPLVNGAANYESTITVNGQIQQTSASNLTTHTYLLIVIAKS